MVWYEGVLVADVTVVTSVRTHIMSERAHDELASEAGVDQMTESPIRSACERTAVLQQIGLRTSDLLSMETRLWIKCG
jgi:hypothetical protein